MELSRLTTVFDSDTKGLDKGYAQAERGMTRHVASMDRAGREGATRFNAATSRGFAQGEKDAARFVDRTNKTLAQTKIPAKISGLEAAFRQGERQAQGFVERVNQKLLRVGSGIPGLKFAAQGAGAISGITGGSGSGGGGGILSGALSVAGGNLITSGLSKMKRARN